MNKLNVLIRKQFTFLDEGEITKEVEEKEVQSQKNWKDRYKNIYKNINIFLCCFIIVGENKVQSVNQNYFELSTFLDLG